MRAIDFVECDKFVECDECDECDKFVECVECVECVERVYVGASMGAIECVELVVVEVDVVERLVQLKRLEVHLVPQYACVSGS